MPHDFMPGLAGVPAAKSAISDVDGQRGVLEYRGIRVEELCLRSSYLETAYLLLFGHLPSHLAARAMGRRHRPSPAHQIQDYRFTEMPSGAGPSHGRLASGGRRVGDVLSGPECTGHRKQLLVCRPFDRQTSHDRRGLGATAAWERLLFHHATISDFQKTSSTC